jgi:hypothetical protein
MGYWRHMLDRSVLFAAALGAGLGLSWVLFGSTGWLLSGVVLPIALLSYVISARWTEMGALLLPNGAIPLPFLALFDPTAEWFGVTSWRLESFTITAAGVALPAALILTALGAAVLLVTAVGNRRQADRARRLAGRRR